MKPEYFEDPMEALGMCLITAEDFSIKNSWGLICVRGLNYRGREHWASCRFTADDLSDAVVRDGTLRQFSMDAPPLWEGELDDWLDDVTELLNDHLLYAVYASLDREAPFYEDVYIREDIEPGNMTYGWEARRAVTPQS